jgi:hypothetical protein
MLSVALQLGAPAAEKLSAIEQLSPTASVPLQVLDAMV